MNETLFFIIVIVGMTGMVAFFYITGKKALQIFHDPSVVKILYEEKGASGRANDSLLTKAGGASGVLHVVLTSEELWIKTGVLFGWIVKCYKLLNKIPRDQIVRTNKLNKRNVVVYFRDTKGKTKSVSLKLRNPDKFIELLGV